MPRPFTSLEERFDNKIERGARDKCWLWQGARSKAGYGQIRSAGRGPLLYAHRVAYERYVGPIPEGLDLDHLCRNRGCCNPAHLEPVTRAENLRRGERVKLTAELVEQIRISEGSHVALAERFGVSPRTICAVRHNEVWA